MASLAAANADFCFNLFREIDNSQESGNVFFSSFSLFTALALVRLGARGDSASRIDKMLHFNTVSGCGNASHTQLGLQSQLKRVLSDINASHKDYQLSISNGVFAEKVFDIHKIENKLTYWNLMDWTNPRKMAPQYVEVFLPQFKIEKNYEIKHYFKALGLTDIFDKSRADLSGIAVGGRLYLSKLTHKSYIEATEEGTKAAATMETNIVEKQLPESVVFRADHPFLFFIRKNDIILFSGKVSCP